MSGVDSSSKASLLDSDTITAAAATSSSTTPTSERLRLCDLDLKLIVKDTIDDDDDRDTTEKEYWVYGVVFAKHSKFIDATLSSGMREQETREIVLNDTSPEIFDLAIQYLEDPLASRDMTAHDALKVVEFYDKYEFTMGLKLCDYILGEFIEGHLERCNSMPPDFDLELLVSAIAAAGQFQLQKAGNAAMEVVECRVLDRRSPFGATIFTAQHIQQMHPILIRACLKNTSLLSCLDVTQDELESSLFPRFFVERTSKYYTARTLQTISVSGTHSSADGEYQWNGSSQYLNPRPSQRLAQLSYYSIARHKLSDGDWAIVVSHTENFGPTPTHYQVLWKRPHSSTLEIPPLDHWEPVAGPHHHPRGEMRLPRLRYTNFGTNDGPTIF